MSNLRFICYFRILRLIGFVIRRTMSCSQSQPRVRVFTVFPGEAGELDQVRIW